MHRVHQDVRSSQLGILSQRTIGRAALVTLKAERFKAPLLRRTISMGDCRSCSPSRGLVTFCYRRVFAGCSRWGDGPLTDPTADHPAVAAAVARCPIPDLAGYEGGPSQELQPRYIEFVGQNGVATGDLFGQAGQDGTFSG